MKKALLLALIISVFSVFQVNGQPVDSMDFYLLTVEPGTEVYSIYGHTAIRVVVRGTETDIVYNWGTFDFETPNFAYRFAKGRLDYLLDVCSYQTFLEVYSFEARSVWSQTLNFNADEKRNLVSLLNENLRPENKSYRYNFFFDNCATRVRDIIEKSLNEPVVYKEVKCEASFRDLIDECQEKLPWLDFGADFLLGLPADKKATFRDQMFLPVYLMDNMSGATLIHSGISEPLLGKADMVLDMRGVKKDVAKPWIPSAIVWLIFIFVLLVTFVLGLPLLGKISDWIFFILFSILSVVLFFCTFFSDHQALHYNMLLIAFNPLLPVITFYIFAGKKCRKLCKLAISLAVLYFAVALIAGQGIHPVTIPLVLILIIRLFKHCEFGKEEVPVPDKNNKSL